MKGLSRLPVTEEIAGSNPVERAIKSESLLVALFLWLPFCYAKDMTSSDKAKQTLEHVDNRIITTLQRIALPAARIAIFIVFFWFGFLKLIGLSPADALALELVEKTIGMSYFPTLFFILSLFECLIGVLFLIPRLTRLAIPLLFIHMAMVCSPLVLLPHTVWSLPFVPTLEGQYIIKNCVIIAAAIGIAAATKPLRLKSLQQ